MANIGRLVLFFLNHLLKADGSFKTPALKPTATVRFSLGSKFLALKIIKLNSLL